MAFSILNSNFHFTPFTMLNYNFNAPRHDGAAVAGGGLVPHMAARLGRASWHWLSALLC
jgi:hypothetical protein